MPLSEELAHAIVTQVAQSPSWTAILQLLRDRMANRIPTDAVSPDLNRALERYRELVAGGNVFARSSSTASSLLIPPAKTSATTIDALVETQDAYAERVRASEQHTEAIGNHQSKYLGEWQERVKMHSERAPEDMLTSLWKSGLSWRDIARSLKVSIAAVQKWRSGDKMSPKNFARLRDFVAAYDTVAAHKPGVDIASWIDIPILTDVPITPRDIWTRGDHNIFFEYALGDLKPEAALDAFEADWRQHYLEDGFETFVGEDGHLSIGTRSR